MLSTLSVRGLRKFAAKSKAAGEKDSNALFPTDAAEVRFEVLNDDNSGGCYGEYFYALEHSTAATVRAALKDACS